jgi:type IV pilus assembly protein PilA
MLPLLLRYVYLSARGNWRANNRSKKIKGCDGMKLRKCTGFTVVEMMVVVAILAILAMIAIPSGIERIIREQVAAAIPLAEAAKEPAAAQWKATKTLPVDNKEAGLPAPDKVVSNLISSLVVDNGVIHMTFGNKARSILQGKVLSIRPAVIEESQAVPVAWVCGNAPAPAKMVVSGANKTNIDPKFLPFACK